MPPRSLPGEFFGNGEAPPSYDIAFTPQEFEAKAAAVAEQTRVSNGKEAVHDSGPSKGVPAASGQYDEFEDWDDAKFEAAAAAYQLRLARMRSASSSSQPAASSSSNRAQSPRPNAGTPVALSPATSLQHHSSPPPRKPTQSPGQLPPTNQSEHIMQRGLPQQPTEVYPGGRSNSDRQRPGITPQPMPQVPGDTSEPPAWMSGASSDGHGRASTEVPPPFASMDPQMNFASPPPSIQDHDGPASPLRPPPNIRDARYSVPAPPPLNIPQVPAAAPLPPTRSPSPLTFVPPPQSSYRHSDVPSPSVHTINPSPAPRQQRASDIPSASGRMSALSSVCTPPPMFAGTHHGFVLSYDKKTPFAPRPAEPTSAAAALYASAMSKTHGPNVRADLNKMAYQDDGHNQPAYGVKEEVHHPGSFYSSSVSSVMKKRALPPQPQQRRQTNDAQYSQYSPQTPPQTPTQHNPYALPPGAAPPMHNPVYGHSTQSHPSQAFYTQAHIQSPELNAHGYPSHFSAPQQQHQQLHHAPPQGYPPAPVQNHWVPTPEMWNNYGRP